MPSGTKHPSAVDLARCQIEYFVELARASSHIASTHSSATQRAAIAETFSEFVERHGAQDFSVFVELLARHLEARRSPEAAGAVRQDLRLHLNVAL
ncbi:hypothetical protein GNZ13_41320 [Paraburkholderia sp. 5N]|uniref:Uncharacterized protein n=2 Tax=Paraburkholderia elongata TaxID=2675747 RepID=A0A972SM54_9BURK|nr:hypothetical protein [Paraburkholderia elongata]